MASATEAKESTGASKKAPLMKTFEIYRWVGCSYSPSFMSADVYITSVRIDPLKSLHLKSSKWTSMRVDPWCWMH